MNNQSNVFGWSEKPGVSELEEGELDELSNDDDYSPGSLVIDHVEQGMYCVSVQDKLSDIIR